MSGKPLFCFMKLIVTQKAKEDAPNYRNGGPLSTQICSTCRFKSSTQINYCDRFDFRFSPTWICDDYRPNVQAVQARSRQLGKATKETPMNVFKIKASPTKTERDGIHPASHYLKVPDRQKPSTWGLRVRNVDGELDPRLMGAARAALHEGFRGNKFEGDNKAKHIDQLKKLYERMDRTPPGTRKEHSDFVVLKDRSGDYRWLMISSNAYKDRDGEIVSQEALQFAVEMGEHAASLGPLRWWHTPDMDMGTCDFQMLHGKMLIESGTFNSEKEALAVKKVANDLGVSIGFRHPPNEPINGVYKHAVIFERSLLPKGRAANPFTSLVIQGDSSMATKEEKKAAFVELLGLDLARQYLGEASQKDEALESAGIEFKEVGNLSKMSPDELRQYADKLNDMATEKEAQVAESGEIELNAEAYKQSIVDAVVARVVPAVVSALQGQSVKEAEQVAELKASVEEQTATVNALREQLAKAEGALLETQESVKALSAEQPPAIASGYRPTLDGPANPQEIYQTEKAKADGNPINDALAGMPANLAPVLQQFGNFANGDGI